MIEDIACFLSHVLSCGEDVTLKVQELDRIKGFARKQRFLISYGRQQPRTESDN